MASPVNGLAKEHLSPTQRRILRLLIDKGSYAETSTEIGTELGLTRFAVEDQLKRIYDFYGVKSARGLFRFLDAIAEELGK